MPGRPLLSSMPLSEVIKEILRGVPGGPMVKTLLPMQRAWVQSLVGELRSHMPKNKN